MQPHSELDPGPRRYPIRKRRGEARNCKHCGRPVDPKYRAHIHRSCARAVKRGALPPGARCAICQLEDVRMLARVELAGASDDVILCANHQALVRPGDRLVDVWDRARRPPVAAAPNPGIAAGGARRRPPVRTLELPAPPAKAGTGGAHGPTGTIAGAVA